jgi:hypothetical protein
MSLNTDQFDGPNDREANAAQGEGVDSSLEAPIFGERHQSLGIFGVGLDLWRRVPRVLHDRP